MDEQFNPILEVDEFKRDYLISGGYITVFSIALTYKTLIQRCEFRKCVNVYNKVSKNNIS